MHTYVPRAPPKLGVCVSVVYVLCRFSTRREVMTNVRANASRWEALSNAGVTIPEFLESWPPSLLNSTTLPPLAAAAIASAAASTSANATAPAGCKVQVINQRIKEQKAVEGVTVTKIDLRPLLSQGEMDRHRHSGGQHNPLVSPKPNSSKSHSAAQVQKPPVNGKS